MHQRRFLECFACCGSVLQASRWAGLHRNSHYGWLKEDPTYRSRFEDAEVRAARTLEDEAVRRAHRGVRKPVYYQGRVVGYTTEYSDALMVKLLAANNPKFRETSNHRLVDGDGKDRDLSAAAVLSDRLDALSKRLAAKDDAPETPQP